MLLQTRPLDRLVNFDREEGLLRAEAGITLSEILDVIVPKGWFLPVTPGTRFVTLGGAIANDVHGKNHHRAGSFGAHVTWLRLLRSNGCEHSCTPERQQRPVPGHYRWPGPDRAHSGGRDPAEAHHQRLPDRRNSALRRSQTPSSSCRRPPKPATNTPSPGLMAWAKAPNWAGACSCAPSTPRTIRACRTMPKRSAPARCRLPRLSPW